MNKIQGCIIQNIAKMRKIDFTNSISASCQFTANSCNVVLLQPNRIEYNVMLLIKFQKVKGI